MGNWRKRASSSALVTLLCVSAGCGGAGSSTSNVKPPPSPLPPDFAITLSASSLSISQGTTAAPITVSVATQNGFTGAIQVILAGAPNGVLSNPASPFTIPSGASTPVVLGALPNAPTGNFTITAQGTSGSLSHSATLALAIEASLGPPLPRTTYVRTDAVAVSDDPPGEPHHRRIAYDVANKHVFVANRAMNRVEVFSSLDQTRVAQINVPAASSADVSADAATLWVGTPPPAAPTSPPMPQHSGSAPQPSKPSPSTLRR